MKWFKHDANALQDAKIEKLIMKYGIEGYGLYFACVEIIAGNLSADNFNFELEHDSELLGYKFKIDTLRVEEIIKYCIQLKLFELNGNSRITCMKLAKRLDISTSNNPEIKKILQSNKDYQKLLDSNSRLDKIRLDENREDKKRLEKEKINGSTNQKEVSKNNKNNNNNNTNNINLTDPINNKKKKKKKRDLSADELIHYHELVKTFDHVYYHLYKEKITKWGKECTCIKNMILSVGGDLDLLKRKYDIFRQQHDKYKGEYRFKFLPSIMLGRWDKLVEETQYEIIKGG